MENVSLLENLREWQLKTEMRNGEILEQGCSTIAFIKKKKKIQRGLVNLFSQVPMQASLNSEERKK